VSNPSSTAFSFSRTCARIDEIRLLRRGLAGGSRIEAAKLPMLAVHSFMASVCPCGAASTSLRCPLALSLPFASHRPAVRLPAPPLLPRCLAASTSRAASALEALILESESDDEDKEEGEEAEAGMFQGEAWAAGADERDAVRSPELEVFELEELPEQWRRSRIAWLCKELPAYKHSTFSRILNAQRKWITQDDATYVAVHCLRIRNNTAAFRVSISASPPSGNLLDLLTLPSDTCA
jgi:hypothetical protein